MRDRIHNVLFFCTGNSARSIMAEAILNKDGAGRFRAFSAGSDPKGEVNPFTLHVLERYGYSLRGLRSKSWDEFAVPNAPMMDFILTVCDKAGGETCPTWPGRPATARWGVGDPSAFQGSYEQKERAFAFSFSYLKTRIGAFLSLPLDSLDEAALDARLRDIGELSCAGDRGRRCCA